MSDTSAPRLIELIALLEDEGATLGPLDVADLKGMLLELVGWRATSVGMVERSKEVANGSVR